MEIRKVETVQQVLDLVPIGEKAFSSMGMTGSFCSEALISFCACTIKSGAGAVLGAYKDGVLVGAVGGIIYTDPFRGDISCQELFWYVEPEHRGVGGALLQKLERWARGKGAKRIIMVALASSMPQAVGEIYKRRGYTELETSYVKEW